MATINFKITEDMLNTSIPNEFIDNYMPYANPTYSCIYIYALRHCTIGSKAIQTKDIAEIFKILESDVLRAWEYWADKKLVKVITENDSFSIEFLPILKPAEIVPIVKIETKSFGEAPQYSPKELELYKGSYEEINDLFLFCEEALGKMLSAKELSTLYSFYDWLRLPYDVIKYLIDYCAKNNHRRMKYIESIAIDWAENNIDTKEKAEAHLHIYNKDYRSILKALGLSGRNPAPIEIKYMDRWLNQYNLPLNIILEACDKTVLATIDKGVFKYVESILSSWHGLNVKTVDDIKKNEANYKENKKPATKKSTPQRVNKFANFKQREKDYDDIEKMEAELLLNGMKDKI